MAEPHVRLVKLSKRFLGDTAAAVDDISLEIPRASFTTLLGPSGCGKTTTLRMIAGFYEPEAGDIFIGQRRVNDVPVHRRKTAMVFQDYALFPHMTVAENVGYGLRIAHVGADQSRQRVRETLDFLSLTGLEQRYPNQLSGGQQQRVALARALVMNPEVLLLDEPLSNLDARLRIAIRAELISIQRQLEITTIYVTHDQDEALAMSDWVAVMDHGRMIQWGTPWEVYYRPRTAFMAEFLGSVNLISAPIVGFDGRTVRVNLAGQPLALAVDTPPSGDQVLLSIRPETLSLGSVTRTTTPTPVTGGTAAGTQTALAADEGFADGYLALAGEVARRTFLGHLMRYTVRIGEQEWLVDQSDPGSASLAEGAVVVQVNPRRVHIIPDPHA
ncbi:MAG: ABC transporter ATP-binding protein [Chloroflexi bacterium]|nr:ABC transporter ATP-binding protein [Chloroflexota bacterium]